MEQKFLITESIKLSSYRQARAPARRVGKSVYMDMGKGYSINVRLSVQSYTTDSPAEGGGKPTA